MWKLNTLELLPVISTLTVMFYFSLPESTNDDNTVHLVCFYLLQMTTCYHLFSFSLSYLAMHKEKQIQGKSQRQRQDAHVFQITAFSKQPDLKLQTSILKEQDKMVQKQQDALEGPKVDIISLTVKFIQHKTFKQKYLFK